MEISLDGRPDEVCGGSSLLDADDSTGVRGDEEKALEYSSGSDKPCAS